MYGLRLSSFLATTVLGLFALTVWGTASVLERTLLTAQESYLPLFRLDKALDPVRLRQYLTEAKSDFQSIPEIWKLQKLGTNPAFQP